MAWATLRLSPPCSGVHATRMGVWGMSWSWRGSSKHPWLRAFPYQRCKYPALCRLPARFSLLTSSPGGMSRGGSADARGSCRSRLTGGRLASSAHTPQHRQLHHAHGSRRRKSPKPARKGDPMLDLGELGQDRGSPRLKIWHGSS